MHRPEQQQKTTSSLTAVLAPPHAGTSGTPDSPMQSAPVSRNGVDRAPRAPELYAWDIDDEHGQEEGVTDDCGRAIGHVRAALADAWPGTSGKSAGSRCRGRAAAATSSSEPRPPHISMR
ncbi:hypothetical protein ACFYTC_35810 [Actinomadura nitritigenes]|uniref:hypothetical protein n=1 Tax=Actinomadura nitritigenes TaxID=134602 RepID=UPI0036816339